MSSPPTPAAPPLVVAPAGFRLPTPAEVATGPASLRRVELRLLGLWDGGPVNSESARGISRRVVRYGPRFPLGAAMVESESLAVGLLGGTTVTALGLPASAAGLKRRISNRPFGQSCLSLTS